MSKPKRVEATGVFDISDIKVEMKSVTRKKITLTFTSEEDLTLLRFYLKLWHYKESMEHEMGVLDEHEEAQ